MDGVIQIGFLVLAVDRLLAIASIVAFVVATPLLADVLGLRPPRMVVALLAGAFASRAAYVVEHLDTFRKRGLEAALR